MNPEGIVSIPRPERLATDLQFVYEAFDFYFRLNLDLTSKDSSDVEKVSMTSSTTWNVLTFSTKTTIFS